jgi:hypothetical protein
MAWEWSHSAEAYDFARDFLGEKMAREELVIMAAEWDTFDRGKVEGAPAFDQEFYKERLAFYAGHAIETLTEKIWARMEEQRTCTNGGFKLWGCPYGCARHLVPVDDD